MRKTILILLMVCLISGCATLPGSINECVSGFDKTAEIKMEPAWVGNSFSDNPIKLGLYKTSKMDADKAILTVIVQGAYNFALKESLKFNIDGNIVSFDSVDAITNVEPDIGQYFSCNWSSKRYEVTKDLIKQLIGAKEVWVKVNLIREYFEAKFSVDGPMVARPSFRKFYNKVWGVE